MIGSCYGCWSHAFNTLAFDSHLTLSVMWSAQIDWTCYGCIHAHSKRTIAFACGYVYPASLLDFAGHALQPENEESQGHAHHFHETRRPRGL